ncbi:hypothetical protein SRU_2853 [Salinibacter ruber DSM 13855]|uniref:Uncharacterized protein n=1 Tax=Salinibacter ruber (strain DSM 13855 / M31) TaxID=309807 RepID=Q2RYN8_SALRD|nr:hypothetical protein SRU_2853 [Salinibacter ruber DSM 13855]
MVPPLQHQRPPRDAPLSTNRPVRPTNRSHRPTSRRRPPTGLDRLPELLTADRKLRVHDRAVPVDGYVVEHPPQAVGLRVVPGQPERRHHALGHVHDVGGTGLVLHREVRLPLHRLGAQGDRDGLLAHLTPQSLKPTVVRGLEGRGVVDPQRAVGPGPKHSLEPGLVGIRRPLCRVAPFRRGVAERSLQDVASHEPRRAAVAHPLHERHIRLVAPEAGRRVPVSVHHGLNAPGVRGRGDHPVAHKPHREGVGGGGLVRLGPRDEVVDGDLPVGRCAARLRHAVQVPVHLRRRQVRKHHCTERLAAAARPVYCLQVRLRRHARRVQERPQAGAFCLLKLLLQIHLRPHPKLPGRRFQVNHAGEAGRLRKEGRRLPRLRGNAVGEAHVGLAAGESHGGDEQEKPPERWATGSHDGLDHSGDKSGTRGSVVSCASPVCFLPVRDARPATNRPCGATNARAAEIDGAASRIPPLPPGRLPPAFGPPVLLRCGTGAPRRDYVRRDYVMVMCFRRRSSEMESWPSSFTFSYSVSEHTRVLISSHQQANSYPTAPWSSPNASNLAVRRLSSGDVPTPQTMPVVPSNVTQ